MNYGSVLTRKRVSTYPLIKYRPSLAPRAGASGGGEGVPGLVAKVRTAVKKVPAFFGVLRDTGGADDGRRGTPDAGRNPLTPLDS